MTSTSDEVGHTATPWFVYDEAKTVSAVNSPEDGGDIVCDAPEDATESMKRWDANAAFIVRAVNSHDSLVKALENAESALRYCEQNSLSPNDILRPKVEVTIKSITAALSQAKGGK